MSTSDKDQSLHTLWYDHIFIGSDHGGVGLKNHLHRLLVKQHNDTAVHDLGVHEDGPVDYPLIVKECADHMHRHPKSCAILICGSGIGVSIAANRFPFLRAALITEPVSASLCRAHNNANVLCLGARLTGTYMAEQCVQTFLSTAFEEGRHAVRVSMLETLYAPK